MDQRSEHIEVLPPRDRRWAVCGCCHLRIKGTKERPAVWLGTTSFHAPAICVCIDCLRLALGLLLRPSRRRKAVRS